MTSLTSPSLETDALVLRFHDSHGTLRCTRFFSPPSLTFSTDLDSPNLPRRPPLSTPDPRSTHHHHSCTPSSSRVHHDIVPPPKTTPKPHHIISSLAQPLLSTPCLSITSHVLPVVFLIRSNPPRARFLLYPETKTSLVPMGLYLVSCASAIGS